MFSFGGGVKHFKCSIGKYYTIIQTKPKEVATNQKPGSSNKPKTKPSNSTIKQYHQTRSTLCSTFLNPCTCRRGRNRSFIIELWRRPKALHPSAYISLLPRTCPDTAPSGSLNRGLTVVLFLLGRTGGFASIWTSTSLV